MRKNIWIGFFVVGASTLPSGLSLVGTGFLLYLMWTEMLGSLPIPSMPLFVTWLFYGMIIVGAILTVVGIAFIVAGYQRYSAEQEFDERKGLRA